MQIGRRTWLGGVLSLFGVGLMGASAKATPNKYQYTCVECGTIHTFECPPDSKGEKYLGYKSGWVYIYCTICHKANSAKAIHKI
jgi:hypothetical protein